MAKSSRGGSAHLSRDILASMCRFRLCDFVEFIETYNTSLCSVFQFKFFSQQEYHLPARRTSQLLAASNLCMHTSASSPTYPACVNGVQSDLNLCKWLCSHAMSWLYSHWKWNLQHSCKSSTKPVSNYIWNLTFVAANLIIRVFPTPVGPRQSTLLFSSVNGAWSWIGRNSSLP